MTMSESKRIRTVQNLLDVFCRDEKKRSIGDHVFLRSVFGTDVVTKKTIITRCQKILQETSEQLVEQIGLPLLPESAPLPKMCEERYPQFCKAIKTLGSSKTIPLFRAFVMENRKNFNSIDSSFIDTDWLMVREDDECKHEYIPLSRSPFICGVMSFRCPSSSIVLAINATKNWYQGTSIKTSPGHEQGQPEEFMLMPLHI